MNRGRHDLMAATSYAIPTGLLSIKQAVAGIRIIPLFEQRLHSSYDPGSSL
jgi:hypothetical protein